MSPRYVLPVHTTRIRVQILTRTHHPRIRTLIHKRTRSIKHFRITLQRAAPSTSVKQAKGQGRAD